MNVAKALGCLISLCALAQSVWAQTTSLPTLVYQKQKTREATETAAIAATGQRLPKVELGPWWTLVGIDPKYASDGSTELAASYLNGGRKVEWSTLTEFKDGQWYPVKEAGRWFYRTLKTEQGTTLTLIFSAKRPLNVRLNGAVLPADLGPPGWLVTQIPNLDDKVRFSLQLKPGVNHLSVQVTEPTDFFFGTSPLSAALQKQLDERLTADFPTVGEEFFYKMETIQPPTEVVLEIGGMTFLPDGTLLVCTRRGEIWKNKGDRWILFASGLQEPLGIWADKTNEAYVVQRSELTRVVDTDGDGKADFFQTITSECGISAGQHAYIFGPVRDSKGNFWGAISGIGTSGNGKYFGWTFKVTPQGEFIPWSCGIRSPNGLVMTPDDEFFVADNQGEYMGTSPLHHVTKGAFHGHPTGLKWDPTFTGDPARAPIEELAKRRKFPAILFPYGSMGQSISQPLVDTTGGKFGAFAGQMFIGDVTKCNVMRVALEKVGGEFQGACFPFRSGFQAGNNRLAFSPDGTLYVGQTDRGWGSIGGHDHGLQRLVWTGRTPLEIETMKLKSDGFELRFTAPLDSARATDAASYSLQHYYYLYRAQYGSPQMENTPVTVQKATLAADRRTVQIKVANLVTEKIYELHFENLRGADGVAPLHSVAYYTLNRLADDNRAGKSGN